MPELVGSNLTNGSKKGYKPPTVTHRFALKLFTPTKHTNPTFNYRDLVRKRQGGHISDDEIFGDNEEHKQMQAIVARLQETYKDDTSKKHVKMQAEDLMDLGMGYDKEDPFIDDAEAYDELVPSCMDTAKGGFYVNDKQLTFQPVFQQDSHSDSSQSSSHHKKKKKRKKDNCSDSDSSNNIRKSKKHKKKNIQSDSDSSANEQKKHKHKKKEFSLPRKNKCSAISSDEEDNIPLAQSVPSSQRESSQESDAPNSPRKTVSLVVDSIIKQSREGKLSSPISKRSTPIPIKQSSASLHAANKIKKRSLASTADVSPRKRGRPPLSETQKRPQNTATTNANDLKSTPKPGGSKRVPDPVMQSILSVVGGASDLDASSSLISFVLDEGGDDKDRIGDILNCSDGVCIDLTEEKDQSTSQEQDEVKEHTESLVEIPRVRMVGRPPTGKAGTKRTQGIPAIPMTLSENMQKHVTQFKKFVGKGGYRAKIMKEGGDEYLKNIDKCCDAELVNQRQRASIMRHLSAYVQCGPTTLNERLKRGDSKTNTPTMSRTQPHTQYTPTSSPMKTATINTTTKLKSPDDSLKELLALIATELSSQLSKCSVASQVPKLDWNSKVCSYLLKITESIQKGENLEDNQLPNGLYPFIEAQLMPLVQKFNVTELEVVSRCLTPKLMQAFGLTKDSIAKSSVSKSDEMKVRPPKSVSNSNPNSVGGSSASDKHRPQSIPTTDKTTLPTPGTKLLKKLEGVDGSSKGNPSSLKSSPTLHKSGSSNSQQHTPTKDNVQQQNMDIVASILSNEIALTPELMQQLDPVAIQLLVMHHAESMKGAQSKTPVTQASQSLKAKDSAGKAEYVPLFPPSPSQQGLVSSARSSSNPIPSNEKAHKSAAPSPSFPATKVNDQQKQEIIAKQQQQATQLQQQVKLRIQQENEQGKQLRIQQQQKLEDQLLMKQREQAKLLQSQLHNEQQRSKKLELAKMEQVKKHQQAQQDQQRLKQLVELAKQEQVKKEQQMQQEQQMLKQLELAKQEQAKQQQQQAQQEQQRLKQLELAKQEQVKKQHQMQQEQQRLKQLELAKQEQAKKQQQAQQEQQRLQQLELAKQEQAQKLQQAQQQQKQREMQKMMVAQQQREQIQQEQLKMKQQQMKVEHEKMNQQHQQKLEQEKLQAKQLQQKIDDEKKRAAQQHQQNVQQMEVRKLEQQIKQEQEQRKLQQKHQPVAQSQQPPSTLQTKPIQTSSASCSRPEIEFIHQEQHRTSQHQQILRQHQQKQQEQRQRDLEVHRLQQQFDSQHSQSHAVGISAQSNVPGGLSAGSGQMPKPNANKVPQQQKQQSHGNQQMSASGGSHSHQGSTQREQSLPHKNPAQMAQQQMEAAKQHQYMFGSPPSPANQLQSPSISQAYTNQHHAIASGFAGGAYGGVTGIQSPFSSCSMISSPGSSSPHTPPGHRNQSITGTPPSQRLQQGQIQLPANFMKSPTLAQAAGLSQSSVIVGSVVQHATANVPMYSPNTNSGEMAMRHYNAHINPQGGIDPNLQRGHSAQSQSRKPSPSANFWNRGSPF